MHKQPRPVEVLLIADSPGDAFLFSSGIGRRSQVPVKMQVINEAATAVKAVAENLIKPDLIVLDLELKQDGFEVLRELRQDKRAIPVLIVSSSEEWRDIRTSFELGASAYVAKPHDFDEFMRVIKSICSWWIEPIQQASAAVAGR